MSRDAARNRFAKLEAVFSNIMDAPLSERDQLVEFVRSTDAALAKEVEELIRTAEGRVPQLDDPQVPSIAQTDSSPLLDVTVGQWKVERLIGRGGWADVYEASQSSPARRCALKVLRLPWLCTLRTLQRFHDEADLLARIEHPGIARVYGAGIARVSGVDVPYMALELVRDALPINTYADRHALQPLDRLNLIAEVCDAVHAVHRHGVLHRDLKPSNILIGSDGRPRVIDFGVAYAIDHAHDARTLTGEFIGTVGYMSPERLAVSSGSRCGDRHCRDAPPPDARWDVYSLGVILYELMTGKSPFTLPQNVAAAVATVQQSTAIPPGKRNPSIPHDVCTIIETAIERDPARRYQSVADLAADIHRFLTNRPIAARPTPLRRHALLAIRRHPAMTAAAACSLLGIILVLATAIYGWHATHRELQATELSLGVIENSMSTARSRRTGDSVRISDLLSQLEQPLNEDRHLSPRVAARLHDVVGRTYEDLADYDSALKHYTAGLEAARSVWGDTDPNVIKLKIELAGSLYDHNDPAGAAAMLEDLLATSRQLDPATLAKAKNDLAVAYMKSENWPDAERVGREALELYSSTVGNQHPRAVQTLINLGANALRQGQLELACDRLTLGITRAEALGSDGVSSTIHARSFLGHALARLGRFQESRETCALAEADAARTIGRDHPVYFKLSLEWAKAALARGDESEAAAYARDVITRSSAAGDNAVIAQAKSILSRGPQPYTD